MHQKHPIFNLDALPMVILSLTAIGWGILCMYQAATEKTFRLARKDPAFPFTLPEGFFENEENIPDEPLD